MDEERKDALDRDELQSEEGALLPDREAMSTIVPPSGVPPVDMPTGDIPIDSPPIEAPPDT